MTRPIHPLSTRCGFTLADTGYTPRSVLHVGASTGKELDYYNTLGLERVVWIEARPRIAEILEGRIRRYTPADCATDHRVINRLIADENGKVFEFKITSNSAMSSSIFELEKHKEVWPSIEVVERVEMRGARLETILEDEGLGADTFDLLVVDVQGAELMVLDGIGPYLDSVRVLMIEVSTEPYYAGGVLFDELDPWLKARGFELYPNQRLPAHGDQFYGRHVGG